MKRGLFIGVILIIFVMSLVSSLQINSKTNYNSGETFLANFSGNIQEIIGEEQVGFYRNNILVPMIFDIGKIKDVYYIYAILPIKEQNYTLKIKNVNYKDSSGEHKQDLILNFSVSANKADFSVEPGFLSDDEDFELTLRNNLDNEINIVSNFLGEEKETPISAISSEEVSFSIEGYSGMNALSLKSENTKYQLPVFIEGNLPPYNNGTIETNKTNQTTYMPPFFSSKTISGTSNLTKITFYNFLVNPSNNDITNIIFTFPQKLENLSIIPSEIETIKSNSSEKLEFSLTAKTEGNYTGVVKAFSKGKQIANFTISISAKKTFLTNITSNTSTMKNCADLKGNLCKVDEKCSVTTILTFDGVCCPSNGKCNKITTNNSANIWITVFLVVIIGLLLGYVYLKFKRKRNVEKIFSKRINKMSKRLSGEIDEVRGSLET